MNNRKVYLAGDCETKEAALLVCILILSLGFSPVRAQDRPTPFNPESASIEDIEKRLLDINKTLAEQQDAAAAVPSAPTTPKEPPVVSSLQKPVTPKSMEAIVNRLLDINRTMAGENTARPEHIAGTPTSPIRPNPTTRMPTGRPRSVVVPGDLVPVVEKLDRFFETLATEGPAKAYPDLLVGSDVLSPQSAVVEEFVKNTDAAFEAFGILSGFEQVDFRYTGHRIVSVTYVGHTPRWPIRWNFVCYYGSGRWQVLDIGISNDLHLILGDTGFTRPR